MRIAHVITRIEGGGAERNLLGSVVTERRMGHSVTVITGKMSEVYEAKFRDAADVIVLEDLVRELSPYRDMVALLKLRSLLRAQKLDVVHTHESKAGVLGRLISPPTAVIVHTVHMASFGKSYGRVRSMLFRAAERLCARKTDFLVSVGIELASMYSIAGIKPRLETCVLRSPIDVARYGRIRAQRLLKSEDGCAQLLTVGALEQRKRHALIISELAQLMLADDVTLKIAGDGPEFDFLLKVATNLNVAEHVVMLGFVDEVDALYLNADAYIHASSAEGVSQAVMQALIAGVPVVAADVEGLREVETTGLTICDRSGRGMSEAVNAILQTAPAMVPLAAFDDWRPEQVVHNYESFLQRLETAYKVLMDNSFKRISTER